MVLDINKAINFLKTKMYTVDKLCNESTKPQTPRYYINSANGLYYTVMKRSGPSNAQEILNNVLAIKKRFGREDKTIYSMWADVLHKTWRDATKTQYAFKSATEEVWGKVGTGVIYNNNSDLGERSKDENKLNIKCLYCINKMKRYYRYRNSADLNSAISVWKQVLAMFNDAKGGYVDNVLEYREAYKQGLVKITAKNYPELRAIGDYKEATGMWDGNLQNPITGGIYMRYIRDSSGKIVNNDRTFENTESTAAIILGYGNHRIDE